MIVMNIAATYTTLTATLWLTRLIIIRVNAETASFLPRVRGSAAVPRPVFHDRG
jgi:hypothetical protein